jgi:hypothetical protein
MGGLLPRGGKDEYQATSSSPSLSPRACEKEGDDEPTNGLDPTQIKHMRSLITELAESATVLISTHSLQEVQAICDRAIIIKDGSLVLYSYLNGLQKSTKLLVSIDAEGAEMLNMFKSLEPVASVSRQSGRFVCGLLGGDFFRPQHS